MYSTLKHQKEQSRVLSKVRLNQPVVRFIYIRVTEFTFAFFLLAFNLLILLIELAFAIFFFLRFVVTER